MKSHNLPEARCSAPFPLWAVLAAAFAMTNVNAALTTGDQALLDGWQDQRVAERHVHPSMTRAA